MTKQKTVDGVVVKNDTGDGENAGQAKADKSGNNAKTNAPNVNEQGDSVVEVTKKANATE